MFGNRTKVAQTSSWWQADSLYAESSVSYFFRIRFQLLNRFSAPACTRGRHWLTLLISLLVCRGRRPCE